MATDVNNPDQNVLDAPQPNVSSNLSLSPELEKSIATGSGNDQRNSLVVDTKGRNLSEGQQKYFKDSKIRDEEGSKQGKLAKSLL